MTIQFDLLHRLWRSCWGTTDAYLYVKNAQNSLNEPLSDAHKGKTVVITAENGRAVKLVPTPIWANKPRKAGSARGQIWMSDDFDDPLEDFADYME